MKLRPARTLHLSDSPEELTESWHMPCLVASSAWGFRSPLPAVLASAYPQCSTLLNTPTPDQSLQVSATSQSVAPLSDRLGEMRAAAVEPNGHNYLALFDTYKTARDVDGVKRAWQDMRAAGTRPLYPAVSTVMSTLAKTGDISGTEAGECWLAKGFSQSVSNVWGSWILWGRRCCKKPEIWGFLRRRCVTTLSWMPVKMQATGADVFSKAHCRIPSGKVRV